MAIDTCPHCQHKLTEEDAREMAGLPRAREPLPKSVPVPTAFELGKIATRVRIAREVMLAGGPWGLMNRAVAEYVVTSDAPTLLNVIVNAAKRRAAAANKGNSPGADNPGVPDQT